LICILVARKIDKLELGLRRNKSNKSWLVKTAEAMDIELDDDELSGSEDEV